MNGRSIRCSMSLVVARGLLCAGLSFGILWGSAWNATPASADTPKSATRVFLNGMATPVHFNDGDSFEVLAGPHKGTRARLSGYNTLESYGPVHRWGTWHAKELYTIAKLATYSARRGIWHCEGDLSRDTYGRLLWFCLDLAIDQVRRGYAHAMSIDETPGHPDILAAQREAIANKAGIWAHGVPAFIMTSVHSADEGGGKDGKTYNRLVSTRDGHSASRQHSDTYETCDWVCTPERSATDAEVQAAAKALESQPATATIAQKYAAHLIRLAEEYGALGYISNIDDEADAEALRAGFAAVEAAGGFAGTFREGSCVLHVPFETRFREARAKCLD